MPRHHIDNEADRDALFACRNLVSLEFAAKHLEVSRQAMKKAADRAQGAPRMWIRGARRQLMRKYRDACVDMGPSPGPGLPHAWRAVAALQTCPAAQAKARRDTRCAAAARAALDSPDTECRAAAST
jgi:hypothetical protein